MDGRNPRKDRAGRRYRPYLFRHQLRGSVGNFGITSAYEKARQLETLARTGDLTSAGDAYPLLEEALRQFQEALTQLARVSRRKTTPWQSCFPGAKRQLRREEAADESMRILIADDDRVTRRMLEVLLSEWGYETVVACDGLHAWEMLQTADAPKLAILDWVMPGLEGLEVCRKVRQLSNRQQAYLILLTVKGNSRDIVAGLRGGADDYITKPFDLEELQARVQTGFRIVELPARA